MPSGDGPHFSLAAVAPPFLMVSGQLAFGEDGRVVGDDISQQTKQCLENIRQVVSAYGGAITDIVKSTVWLARLEDYADFNRAYAEFFGRHKPARSTVQANLVVPGALVEIEVIARYER